MMISTKEHNLRNTIFFTIKTVALILVICFMIELPVQIIGKVTAANKVERRLGKGRCRLYGLQAHRGQKRSYLQ